MGLLGKIIAAKATQKVVQKLNERSQWPNVERRRSQEYIPGSTPAAPSTWSNNAVVNKAASLYRDNPKLIASLGVVAAAMVLQQLTRKKGF